MSISLLALPALVAAFPKHQTGEQVPALSPEQKRDLEAFVFLVSECAKRDLCPTLYKVVIGAPSKNIVFWRKGEKSGRQIWPEITERSQWVELLKSYGLQLPETITPQDSFYIFFIDEISRSGASYKKDNESPFGIDIPLVEAGKPVIRIFFDRAYYQYPLLRGGRRVPQDAFRGKDLLYFWKGEGKPDVVNAREMKNAKEVLESELIWRIAGMSSVSKNIQILGGDTQNASWQKINYCSSESGLSAEIVDKYSDKIILHGNPNDRAAVEAEIREKLKVLLGDAEKNPELMVKIEDCANELLDYQRQTLRVLYETSKKLKKDGMGHALVVPNELVPYLAHNSESKALEYFIRWKMRDIYPSEKNLIFGLYRKYWDRKK